MDIVLLDQPLTKSGTEVDAIEHARQFGRKAGARTAVKRGMNRRNRREVRQALREVR
ncbi:MAG: hypothetical protein PHQ28_14095 [Mycobacterium sp.]|nr:hypothetical protein [Mycobacterium sp.]